MQSFGDGSSETDVVRLVQDDQGVWRWFFGRDPDFVQAQIARYADQPEATTDAPPDRQLSVHVGICPPGYRGPKFPDDCFANPGAGVAVRMGLPDTDSFADFVLTDDGFVSFAIRGVGINDSLRLIGELPAGTDQFVIVCYGDGPHPLDLTYVDSANTAPAIGVVDVHVGLYGDVGCDWYDVPIRWR